MITLLSRQNAPSPHSRTHDTCLQFDTVILTFTKRVLFLYNKKKTRFWLKKCVCCCCCKTAKRWCFSKLGTGHDIRFGRGGWGGGGGCGGGWGGGGGGGVQTTLPRRCNVTSTLVPLDLHCKINYFKEHQANRHMTLRSGFKSAAPNSPFHTTRHIPQQSVQEVSS